MADLLRLDLVRDPPPPAHLQIISPVLVSAKQSLQVAEKPPLARSD
jgi:hypothetical protein